MVAVLAEVESVDSAVFDFVVVTLVLHFVLVLLLAAAAGFVVHFHFVVLSSSHYFLLSNTAMAHYSCFMIQTPSTLST